MPVQKAEKLAVRMFRDKLTARLGGLLDSVLLFGSKARGDDHPDSDIDLLVICNTGDWHIADEVYSIATDILLECGVALSPKVLSKDDYESMQQNEVAFVQNVRREGLAV